MGIISGRYGDSVTSISESGRSGKSLILPQYRGH